MFAFTRYPSIPVLLFLFTCFPWGTSQAQWSPQNSGVSEDLHGVHFANDTAGWAVGDSGEVLHTIDTGNSWSAQTSGTNVILLGVHAVHEDTAWTAGHDGTVLYTSDGGSNWNFQSTGTSEHLALAHFIDTSEGIAVGANGTVLKTTDGGSTWGSQSSGTNEHLYSVHFEGPSMAWAVGADGTILHSSDGGGTWNSQVSGVSNDLYSVDFRNDSLGYAIGWDGTALRTTDGGSNWTSLPTGVTADLHEAHFVNDSTGWAVGGTTILYTKDSGNTWYSQSNSSLFPFGYVDFVDENNGWVVGVQGTILHTSNGGCQSTLADEAPIVCEGYSVPSGDTSYSTPGTYSDTITNTQGCDSIVNIELHIPNVDTNVVQNTDTLMVQTPADQYQWLDCEDGHSPINGATGQTFAPSSDGTYAVVITDSSCMDTSSCHSVQNVSIEEENLSERWALHPNPTEGRITLDLGENGQEVDLRLTDIRGVELLRHDDVARRRFSFELDEAPGLYFLHVRSGEQRKSFRVVKK